MPLPSSGHSLLAIFGAPGLEEYHPTFGFFLLPWHSFCVSICIPISPFNKDPNHRGLERTPMTSFSHNYHHEDPTSKSVPF